MSIREAVVAVVHGLGVGRPLVGMEGVPDQLGLALVGVGPVEPPVRRPAYVLDVGAVPCVLVRDPLERQRRRRRPGTVRGAAGRRRRRIVLLLAVLRRRGLEPRPVHRGAARGVAQGQEHRQARAREQQYQARPPSPLRCRNGHPHRLGSRFSSSMQRNTLLICRSGRGSRPAIDGRPTADVLCNCRTSDRRGRWGPEGSRQHPMYVPGSARNDAE
jgi:hypothetical protein